jgi:hypothetical protein
MNYTVFVDDNFHYQDESERYCAGRFATAEEALAKCREIVHESVEHCRKPGMTAEEVYEAYVDFGDDPFIMGVKFSAWDDAKQLAIAKHFAEKEREIARQAIIDKLKKDAHRRD